ncbi:MAG: hypothetical protein Ct9H300mP16_09770 [Pseudomonadota bacterium]|nr:MAG: hypothetical protein Ct9H300mP16_09770 [Pseudomonadota bacterium]
MDEAEKHPCGRLKGVIYPMQIDTCSEALLRDSIALAEDPRAPTDDARITGQNRVSGDG